MAPSSQCPSVRQRAMPVVPDSMCGALTCHTSAMAPRGDSTRALTVGIHATPCGVP
jgi:hypothetical protein